MRTSALLTPLLPWLVLLASCSSPPKPPSVDGSKRHPVNASAAIELQACENELHNTRIAATESGRVADSAAGTLAYLSARLRLMSEIRAPAIAPPEGNNVYLLHFDFGSTRVEIASQQADLLLAQARQAPLVLLRGRTDGASDTAVEARIARERADAVRDYLVAGGVPPSRIRATYQAAGDRLADNESPSGRRLNRRVEVEIYRVLPVPISALPSAS